MASVRALWQASTFVVTGQQRQESHVNVLVTRGKALVREPGERGRRFHDLRHTSATLLAQEVRSKVAQERSDHANIVMTLN